jgi:hypothetical protein
MWKTLALRGDVSLGWMDGYIRSVVVAYLRP